MISLSILEQTKFLVIDTETTGVDPNEDRVVEIAAIAVMGNKVKTAYHTLINPQKPIPPETSAIHGIADWDVDGKPAFEEVWPSVQVLVDRADVLVAHNAPFDRSFLPPCDKPWLDTLRLAHHVWPTAPNFQNQTLRYWRRLRLEGLAHSADGDALVTAYLLVYMIRDYLHQGHVDSIEELIRYAETPYVVRKMPFGKHGGKLLEELPPDYVQWALTTIRDMDKDLRWSLEKFIVSNTM